MSHLVATDCRIYLDQYDLSGDSNSVKSGLRTREVPNTCYGASIETSLPGLKGWTVGASGLLTKGDDQSEGVLFDRWDRTTGLITLAPSGSDGDVAYFGQHFQGEYGFNGAIGDALKWTLSGAAKGVVVRGTQLLAKASKSATASGTAYQLGALSASQTMYAALHVFTAPGTSLVVKIQSDDNSGFTSATDRITFSTATTTATSQLSSVAGAVTDDYWRANWTIVGSGPYVFAVSAGIL